MQDRRNPVGRVLPGPGRFRSRTRFFRESDLAAVRGELVHIAADGSLAGERALLFDHNEIVAAAVEALRERYEIRYRYVDIAPDPDGFLPEPFTLHQLRKVHEAVVGEELHKDNFNHRMKPFLEPLTRGGEPVLASNLRGRPATLYRAARPAYPSG